METEEVIWLSMVALVVLWIAQHVVYCAHHYCGCC